MIVKYCMGNIHSQGDSWNCILEVYMYRQFCITLCDYLGYNNPGWLLAYLHYLCGGSALYNCLQPCFREDAILEIICSTRFNIGNLYSKLAINCYCRWTSLSVQHNCYSILWTLWLLTSPCQMLMSSGLNLLFHCQVY